MSEWSTSVPAGESAPGVNPEAETCQGSPRNVLIRPGGNGWHVPALTPEAEARHTAAQRSHRGKAASAKGANGEREVLSAFRELMKGIEAELSEQGYAFVARSEFATRKRLERGTSNRDLGNIPIISIEVKRNENLNLNKAWEQAVRQADGGLLPCLVYRYNREPWRVRTWAALTHYNRTGAVVSYAVGEFSLVDFLTYYGRLYRHFLTDGLAP